MHLQLREFHPLLLAYDSPPFERNALRAEGVVNFPQDWRRGDLAVFTVKRKGYPPSPLLVPPDVEWAEETIQDTRIRVRIPERRGFEDPSLLSLVRGDILPSVSRRDPRRQHVDVWTSGNRVYRCRGGRVLQAILRALASGEPPHAEVARTRGRRLTREEARLISSASDQVLEVVGIEQDDISQYAD